MRDEVMDVEGEAIVQKDRKNGQNEELKYLGQMLTATKKEDKTRLCAIIKRFTLSKFSFNKIRI